MKKGSVYKIIDNRIDKIIYVGQHWYKNTPFDKYMGSGSKIKKLYKEEGKENFRKEIIAYDIFYQKDLDLIEELFIKEYNHNYLIDCVHSHEQLPSAPHNTFQDWIFRQGKHKYALTADPLSCPLPGRRQPSFHQGML